MDHADRGQAKVNPDALENLLMVGSEERFEEFFISLLRAHPDRFSDVVVHDIRDDYRLDVSALDHKKDPPRQTFFELKKVRTAHADLVDRVAAVFAGARAILPSARFVLVVPGLGTQAANDRASQLGVSIWGKLSLAALATPDLLESLLQQAPAAAEPDSRATKSKMLAADLRRLSPGHETWPQYQRLVADVIEHLFVPPLAMPRYEAWDGVRRNRRDIILENSAVDGFWSHVRERYAAEYVVIDAKNFEMPIGKKPVVEIAHYLKAHGCGLFGILATRRGLNKAGHHATRELWISERKLILALSDDDLVEMLTLSGQGGAAEDVPRRRVMDFRLSL